MTINKRGLEGETIVKWIIAFFILVLCVVLIVIFRGKGSVIIEKIRSLFMFGS